MKTRPSFFIATQNVILSHAKMREGRADRQGKAHYIPSRRSLVNKMHAHCKSPQANNRLAFFCNNDEMIMMTDADAPSKEAIAVNFFMSCQAYFVLYEFWERVKKNPIPTPNFYCFSCSTFNASPSRFSTLLTMP